jgi:hypothetical protein
MREFIVVRVTAKNQLLLTGDGKPVDKPLSLSLGGQTVAKATDTIARVTQPFYLAIPTGVKPETLVGKTLSSK